MGTFRQGVPGGELIVAAGEKGTDPAADVEEGDADAVSRMPFGGLPWRRSTRGRRKVRQS